MEQDMKDKIEEAIVSNMPQMVGKALQKRLEEADNIESDNEGLIEKNEELKLEIKHSYAANDTLKDRFDKLKGDSENLESGLRALEATKQDLAIREAVLACKEGASNEKVELMKEMYKVPFQNRILRESVLEDKMQHMEHVDSYNNNSVMRNDMVTPCNKTTEVEEA